VRDVLETGPAYGGGWLDRAADRRGDPDWIAARLADPTSVLLPLWRDASLVRDGDPVRLPVAAAGALLAVAEPVFLGLRDGVAVFTADLSAQPEDTALELAGATGHADVRALVSGLAAADASVLAHARGILHWHRRQRFCGACGSPTRVTDGGSVRWCTAPDCAAPLFPRIEPAVITLVESGDRCLLGRHSGAGRDGWSTLAGFVEVGESLEDAVRREIAEEVGVRIGAVSYRGSQAWPFPAGLMVAFRAQALTTEVVVDGQELVAGRWFTRAELRELRARTGVRRADSIGHHLMRDWLAEDPD
jgi:NAD+ diphosphatase